MSFPRNPPRGEFTNSTRQSRTSHSIQPIQQSQRLVIGHWTLVISFLILTILGLVQSAHAVTIAVTTLSDNFTAPIAGSLRAAINTANADPANSYVINFNVAGGGTLNLAANANGARMLPILTNPSGISINGANLDGMGGGQGAIAIDGGSTSATSGDRIFFVGVPAGTPSSTNGD